MIVDLLKKLYGEFNDLDEKTRLSEIYNKIATKEEIENFLKESRVMFKDRYEKFFRVPNPDGVVKLHDFSKSYGNYVGIQTGLKKKFTGENVRGESFNYLLFTDGSEKIKYKGLAETELSPKDVSQENRNKPMDLIHESKGLWDFIRFVNPDTQFSRSKNKLLDRL